MEGNNRRGTIASSVSQFSTDNSPYVELLFVVVDGNRGDNVDVVSERGEIGGEGEEVVFFIPI